MCGIFGIVGERGDADWVTLARRMDHRGPDAFGQYSDEQVALAHNRLSIIDRSTDANQPMQSDCGRYVIVFNGEIFNFKELRVSLEGAGISFRTQSDTEVLLKLFIEKGEKALDDGDIKELGKLLNENHTLCQELTVSCKELDDLVLAVREAGAIGAKMSGTGRGGLMLAITPTEEIQNKVAAALEKLAPQVWKTTFA